MSPMYEYRCPQCSTKIDQKRAMIELASAPMCGDCLIDMDRVISPTPAIFKGSGWAGKK